MSRHFRLDGIAYDAKALTHEGQAIVDRLTFVRTHIVALTNQQALLSKAKNAYIADLKAEIVRGRSGVDLEALFNDD